MTTQSLSCLDWWEKLQRKETPIADLALNLKRADQAVAVFKKLRLPDVVGQPCYGDVVSPNRLDVVRAIFGSVRDDGTRSISEFFELIPKKNSKTTDGAAIMLTLLILNERPRAELLLVGPTQEIADRAFTQVEGMILADKEGFLQKRFKVRDHVKTIVDLKTKAKLKIKTFDKKVMTGANPVAVLIDELHVLGEMAYAAKVIEQIRGGLEANDEGFLIFITTQSDSAPSGVFKAELAYARNIRDGKVKGKMLPILYELPREIQASKKGKWKNQKLWSFLHPNMGRSRSYEKLIDGYNKAVDTGEEALTIWLSQHLNIEVGISLHGASWAGVRYWEGAADETINFDTLMDRCDVVVFGIDGGGLDDLLGLAGIGRCKTTKDWLCAYKAWAQSDVLERRKNIVSTLRDFEKEGDLVIVGKDEPTRDIQEIAEIIAQFNDAGLLPEKEAVGLDPAGVAAVIDELVTNGIADSQMVAVAQGYRLSGAVWGMERKLKDGTLWHDGSSMMAWCAGNAKAEQRGNAVYITKQAAGKAKIDPLIAGFNAVSLMSRNPQAASNSASYLETGDLVVM